MVEAALPAIGTAVGTDDFFKSFLPESCTAFGRRHPVRLSFVFFFKLLLARVRYIPHFLDQFLVLLEEMLVFFPVTQLSHFISKYSLNSNPSNL